jgi:glycosyltransferase involved in cell wall biosynthesis
VNPSKPARILTLFLSNGGSLSRWRKEGILSREILLYQTLLKQGVFDRVRIFSYDARDVALVAEDPVYAGIEMLTPRAGALYGGRAALWSLAGVVRHRAAIGGSAWLKTNQVSGAWAAVAARVITGRALMIRLGYVLSRRFALNGKRLQAMFARWVEKAAFAAADSIVVTSEAAAAPLKADPATAGKTHLAPTYVDVSAFVAKDAYRFDEPVIYIGRLEPQKNILNLVRGCRLAGIGLDLIGVGSLEPEVRARAAEPGSPIRLLGRMPNEELPAQLRAHTLFALPSLHEGLPKVLIEAMASGMICVGSNIPGNTDLIQDGATGYLIDGFEPEDIAAALTRAQAERKAELGAAARRLVIEHFSLETYVRNEAALYDAKGPTR